VKTFFLKKMVVYSIKDLENLTGIKAHTLRIWEKRYSIIAPKRTDSNIRYYLEEDLKKIMNIALLNQNGYKISRIACMTDVQIRSHASELSDVEKTFESQLDALTFSVLMLNEESFMKIIDANILQHGFTDTMGNVIYPLFDKLGMMQMTECVDPVHTAFVTQLVKRKCLAQIDGLRTSTVLKTKFLLFLPKGEKGELSLLFQHYLIKSKGFCLINLGPDIEFAHIESAHKLYQPDYLFTILDEISSMPDFFQYIKKLSKCSDNAHILLTGAQVFKQNIEYPDNFRIFKSIDDFVRFLDGLIIFDVLEEIRHR